ncbi:unnamed protein product [Ectocarpus sp. 13 AM-2016]
MGKGEKVETIDRKGRYGIRTGEHIRSTGNPPHHESRRNKQNRFQTCLRTTSSLRQDTRSTRFIIQNLTAVLGRHTICDRSSYCLCCAFKPKSTITLRPPDRRPLVGSQDHSVFRRTENDCDFLRFRQR